MNTGNVIEFIGAVKDVTERKQSENALNEMRSELAHAARVATVGALTASIAHEVNQPLSGIITNASTSLLMLADDPPDIDGALESRAADDPRCQPGVRGDCPPARAVQEDEHRE